MDVHAETIAVAIDEGREVRSLGTIPNRPEAVIKLIKKLGDPASLSGLLRGKSHRLRPVLAAHAPGICQRA
jgi:hypothetical protein